MVESARLDDCRAVARIHVDAWRAGYAGIVDPAYLAALSIDQREARWRDAVRTGSPRLLVARDGERVVGWVSYGHCRDDDATERSGEIWAIYVDPPCWSTGAGRRLMDSALAGLRSERFSTASLWVMCENARATGFYQSVGFVRDANSEREFVLGQQQIREVRYVRTTDDAAGVGSTG